VCLGTHYIDHHGICVANETRNTYRCPCKGQDNCYCPPSGKELYFNLPSAQNELFDILAPQGFTQVRLAFAMIQGNCTFSSDLTSSLLVSRLFTVSVTCSADSNRGIITPIYSRTTSRTYTHSSSAATHHSWFNILF